MSALLAPLAPRPADRPRTHRCGVCGAKVFSARWHLSGLLVHVELEALHGDLRIVPELFAGAGLPHVEHSSRRTGLKEHACGSYSGRGPARKVRP